MSDSNFDAQARFFDRFRVGSHWAQPGCYRVAVVAHNDDGTIEVLNTIGERWRVAPGSYFATTANEVPEEDPG